jgi:hypothetical protein
MMMDAANRPVPEVKFENCVIRGKGRGVWVKVSRPVRVEVRHSLAALDGALYLAEGSGKPTGESTLTLNRVTAFVGGPVVELRGGNVLIAEMRASGLPRLNVHADACLFAAVPGAGRPIVEIDNIDPSEAMRLFTWNVSIANRYANFPRDAAYMTVRPGSDLNPKDWNWNDWFGESREPGEQPVAKVTFKNGPADLKHLGTLNPADAAETLVEFPQMMGLKPTDAGVRPDKLPTPYTP